jgi:excisionase family DNA binding protein
MRIRKRRPVRGVCPECGQRLKGRKDKDTLASLLTQTEAASILGLSRQSMQRLLAAGTLKPVQIAGLGRPRYRRADIERLANLEG